MWHFNEKVLLAFYFLSPSTYHIRSPPPGKDDKIGGTSEENSKLTLTFS